MTKDYDGAAEVFRKQKALASRSLALAKSLDGPYEYDGRLLAADRAIQRSLQGLQGMADCGVFVDQWRDLVRIAEDAFSLARFGAPPVGATSHQKASLARLQALLEEVLSV